MKDGSVEVRDGDEARLLTFDVTIMQAYEIINTQEQTDLKQGRRGGGKRNDVRESSWCGWTDECKLL